MDFLWSDEKNEKLKLQRNLSFEDVVSAIDNGRVLDDVRHPHPDRSHQRVMVVEIGGYACGVPYVREGDAMFLKTVYRNRKLQRTYLRST